MGVGLGSTSAATATPFPLAIFFFRDNFDKRLERIPLSSLGNVKLLGLLDLSRLPQKSPALSLLRIII